MRARMTSGGRCLRQRAAADFTVDQEAESKTGGDELSHRPHCVAYFLAGPHLQCFQQNSACMCVLNIQTVSL